ncbi:MAG: hypothetical protein ACI4Q6_01350 [Huintestinicola sp.]
MGITPIGTGMSGIDMGSSGSNASPENIRRTISQLERQRDEYENAKTSKLSPEDPRVKNLNDRIGNLQKRLDKLELKGAKKPDSGECQTCKERRYQDGSDDPGVSFKSATRVNPEAAASAVRGHEMEHVYRNQAKAAREGKEVISQSVRIKTGICPECGKSYVAGGETKTVTRAKSDDRFSAGLSDGADKGSLFDASA